MEAFKAVTGIAAPMMAANIDTDVIMPKQFLKGIDRQGLDRGLFYDLRFLPDGSENPDFILNTAAWRGATFLVVGPNFGCGSSREHAVWGMKQLGIRALIGTSFAGIFNDNCLRNGVLTVCVSEDELRLIADDIAQAENNTLTLDLEEQTLQTASRRLPFSVDALKKEMLINGLDAIGFTLSLKEDILRFEENYFSANPWHKTA